MKQNKTSESRYTATKSIPLTTISSERGHDQRRYDIDWLRALAFLLLIFYHIGMYYVADWDWHIKSDEQYKWLQYLMLLVNQWRMPLIFLVSGFVVCLVEHKVSSVALLRLRFIRLFVPLLFGMYVIVPPQAYYEAIEKFSYAGSYWSFWWEYIRPNSTILPQMRHSELGMLTWNHLWYLVYLWVYTIVYLLVKPILVRTTDWIRSTKPTLPVILIAPILIMLVSGLTLKPLYPKTNALLDDWYNHSFYFSIFIMGYTLAKLEFSLAQISRYRRVWFFLAISLYIGIATMHSGQRVMFGQPILIELLIYSNIWLWLLTILGFVTAYLNKPSRLLSYLNKAVLPWYIIHQTPIIVIASQMHYWGLSSFTEFMVITLGTLISCAALYELIKRFSVTRFLFGMKL